MGSSRVPASFYRAGDAPISSKPFGVRRKQVQVRWWSRPGESPRRAQPGILHFRARSLSLIRHSATRHGDVKLDPVGRRTCTSAPTCVTIALV